MRTESISLREIEDAAAAVPEDMRAWRKCFANKGRCTCGLIWTGTDFPSVRVIRDDEDVSLHDSTFQALKTYLGVASPDAVLRLVAALNNATGALADISFMRDDSGTQTVAERSLRDIKDIMDGR